MNMVTNQHGIEYFTSLPFIIRKQQIYKVLYYTLKS